MQRQTLAHTQLIPDQIDEAEQCGTAPRTQNGGPGQIGGCPPERDPRLACLLAQEVQGSGTDAPVGCVDHTLEGGIVVRVGDQPQIGECIADLRALEEPQSAVNPIGDLGLDQRLFEET